LGVNAAGIVTKRGILKPTFLNYVETVLPNRNPRSITKIKEMDQAILDCHSPCPFTVRDSG
jgi:hypothetical protein